MNSIATKQEIHEIQAKTDQNTVKISWCVSDKESQGA
ncbi:MAG: hypothetical protein H6Q65_46 [Firmicutes bacterium]|nr:hypothetical protein [Bacillota bacterium]